MEKELKLFGVRIFGEDRGGETVAEEDEEEDELEVMRKSHSMPNLASFGTAPAVDPGYISDGGLVQSSRKRVGQERKRGMPWTEEEHITFLAGLEQLGKGDWRGISRKFVLTRTPTQVASHAQKYFLRQTNPNKKKRRSSLFDVAIKDSASPALPTKAAAPETPSFSLKKIDGAAEETKDLFLNNHSVAVQSPPLIVGVEGSRNLIHCSKSQNFSSFNLMAASPSPARVQALPTLSLSPSQNIQDKLISNFQIAPDFLELSLPNCSKQVPAMSSPIEDSDLELRIAPPQPRHLAKLHSHSPVGTIRVV